MFAQFHVPPLIISHNQQQFASIVIILHTSFAYNNNCSLDLYSKNLRTRIILCSHVTCLHTRLTKFFLNYVSSSHTANWIITESHVSSSHMTDWILTESDVSSSHTTDWIITESHMSSSHMTNWILNESHVLSSHTTKWILNQSPLPALSCLLYHTGQQSDECTSKRMSFGNIYKFPHRTRLFLVFVNFILLLLKNQVFLNLKNLTTAKSYVTKLGTQLRYVFTNNLFPIDIQTACKCKQAVYCVFCLRSSFVYPLFYTAFSCCLFISLSLYFFCTNVVAIFLFIC